ncbi:MAG: aminoglycoside phosphotransferase family protein [Vicinamibacterales bacterium]
MSIEGVILGVGLDVRRPHESGKSADQPASALLPKDLQLPLRDRLLDDQWAAQVFAERLGERGRLEVQRVERLRAKYRIGESVRTVHRVWVDGVSYLVSTRMRATGAEAMFADARRTERPCSPLRGVCFDAELKAVFWTFPNDRCLAGLDALSTPLPLIRDLYPGRLSIEVVGYNPERAAIARVSQPDGQAVGFAKLYAANDLEQARRALLWLEHALTAADSPLRVPRLRAWDDRRHLLIVDAVAGQHLDAVPEARLVRAFTALGTSLARLHALPTDASPFTLPRFGAFDDDQLVRAGEVVAWARPDLGDLVRRTVDLLVAHRPSDQQPVCVHGDVNARNWLVALDQPGFANATRQATRDDVGFIDFDVASYGPAAADIASVLALLRTRALTGEWTPQREVQLVAALRNGYEAVRPNPPNRELRWFQAAALLVERAQRSITRVRPDQIAHLESLVADAHAHAVEVSRG